MKNFRFKIKTTIMFIFIMVVFLTSLTTIYFQYKSSNEFALLTTQKVFEKVVDNVVDQIYEYDRTNMDFINLVQTVENGDENIDFEKKHTLTPLITRYMENSNYIYGVYMGFKDDSFYIIYNVDLSTKMRSSLKAPRNARWLIKKHINKKGKIVSQKKFYDKDLNLVSKIVEVTSYKATKRPWYKDALNSKNIIKTKPYVFSALQEPGITYSQLINKEKGIVLSTDITLSSLSKLLKKQALVDGSASFIFKDDGKIIGQFDHIQNKTHENINKAYPKLFIKNKEVIDLERQKIISIKGIEYIKYTTLLKSDFKTKEYLSIISPLKPIIEPYKEKNLDTLKTTILIILLIILPLAFYAVRLIVSPIIELKKQNEKIENEKFDEIIDVKSYFEEISALSNSMVKMAKSIQEKSQSIKLQKAELELLISSFDKNVIFSRTDLNGNITHASEAFCKISGYSLEELLGKPHNIVRHPDMPSLKFKWIWDSLKKEQPIVAEVKNKRKDGSFYWVKSLFEPYYNSKKELVGYSATREEVTDKKAVEELSNNLEIKIEERTNELKVEKDNIEQILSNILLPMLITSKERRVVLYANKFAQDLYEYSIEEMIESPIEDIYTLKHGVEEIISQLNEYGKVYGAQIDVLTTKGKEFVGLLSVVPIYYNNEECYIGMTVDITDQKNMENQIREMHKHTKDSIEHASLIQNAILPDSNKLSAFFNDYFVDWSPKDTVGGDIWLFNELKNKDECLLFFIDCTGHGVPGAFVTMIIKSIEREVVAKINDSIDDEISPAAIMSHFNKTMKQLLKQESKDSKSNVGWDGGIIYYNKTKKILKFAGAETPLFYIDKDNKLHTIKGNRYSVGYKKCDKNYQYRETVLNVTEGMKFYCTTDGYLDQNGGENDFPFGKKRFSKIIEKNHTKIMYQQKMIFRSEIYKYQSLVENNDRNDDITLIGFEI